MMSTGAVVVKAVVVKAWSRALSATENDLFTVIGMSVVIKAIPMGVPD